MECGNNQKLKMLYLVKILREETDDQHYLTMQEILAKLGAYGVDANRKTVYDDMNGSISAGHSYNSMVVVTETMR